MKPDLPLGWPPLTRGGYRPCESCDFTRSTGKWKENRNLLGYILY